MEPFIPDALPIKGLDYTRLIGLVGQANAELARYDGLLQGIVNPQILQNKLEFLNRLQRSWFGRFVKPGFFLYLGNPAAKQEQFSHLKTF